MVINIVGHQWSSGWSVGPRFNPLKCLFTADVVSLSKELYPHCFSPPSCIIRYLTFVGVDKTTSWGICMAVLFRSSPRAVQSLHYCS